MAVNPANVHWMAVQSEATVIKEGASVINPGGGVAVYLTVAVSQGMMEVVDPEILKTWPCLEAQLFEAWLCSLRLSSLRLDSAL